jgi:hypothetical protein
MDWKKAIRMIETKYYEVLLKSFRYSSTEVLSIIVKSQSC